MTDMEAKARERHECICLTHDVHFIHWGKLPKYCCPMAGGMEEAAKVVEAGPPNRHWETLSDALEDIAAAIREKIKGGTDDTD